MPGLAVQPATDPQGISGILDDVPRCKSSRPEIGMKNTRQIFDL
jgi:hypothetical protein